MSGHTPPEEHKVTNYPCYSVSCLYIALPGWDPSGRRDIPPRDANRRQQWTDVTFQSVAQRLRFRWQAANSGTEKKTIRFVMTARQPVKLTKRAVDALSVESGNPVVWNSDLPGFGIRGYASGRKVWCVQTNGPAGGPKRIVLGSYGDVPPDDAARRRAAVAIDRIKQGLDPFPSPPASEPTIIDLTVRYALHGRPCPGELPPEDGQRPSDGACSSTSCRNWTICPCRRWTAPRTRRCTTGRGTSPGKRTQTINGLAKIFRLAEVWDMTPPRRNPCSSVRRYGERLCRGLHRGAPAAHMAAMNLKSQTQAKGVRHTQRLR